MPVHIYVCTYPYACPSACVCTFANTCCRYRVNGCTTAKDCMCVRARVRACLCAHVRAYVVIVVWVVRLFLSQGRNQNRIRQAVTADGTIHPSAAHGNMSPGHFRSHVCAHIHTPSKTIVDLGRRRLYSPSRTTTDQHSRLTAGLCLSTACRRWAYFGHLCGHVHGHVSEHVFTDISAEAYAGK